jgi:pyruvate dehydrogenase E2 component (dihydrolipoamide acetyltransferase)
MADIILPKMGDAMEEGRIVQWLKNVGDAIKKGEPVAELETDKSNVEIEADADGFLTSIVVQAGETAPVGTLIGTIGSEAGAAPAPAAPAKEEKAAAETPAKTTDEGVTPKAEPSTNGVGPTKDAVSTAPTQPTATAATSEPVAAPTATASAPAAAPVSTWKPYDSFVGALPENLGGTASVIGEPIAGTIIGNGSEKVKATPLARAMAQANNLDLGQLRGSGTDGGIVKADIEAALATGVKAAPAAAPAAEAPKAAAPTSSVAVNASEGDTVSEYNAMRRTIAKRLLESKQTIPHFYVTSEIDMEAYLSFREQLNAGAGEGAVKVSVTDLLTKAVSVALVEVPVVNSVFTDNKRIQRKAVNIGIAVSINDGLIVPVVKGTESKSVRAIAAETRPLIEKARSGKLKPEEYTGGTFTISNLGQYDVENFAAIINPGEGAILAVSSIRQVPAVVNGEIVPRKRMKVTLCADHRVMDGVDGAVFLQALKRLLENPLQIVAG